MPETPQDAQPIPETDIIFDCPYCGKSLAIDRRGAGLLITCPDCRRSVQVPEPGPMAASEPDAAPSTSVTAESLAAAHAKIERLVSSLEEIRERRRYLEHLRTDNMARFKQIGGEVEIIQNALDRIVGLLQDAAAEKLSGEAPAQEG